MSERNANYYCRLEGKNETALRYDTVKTHEKEPTILQVRLISFSCIEYLVGIKAVQVLKLVLISFRASRYFFCSD